LPKAKVLVHTCFRFYDAVQISLLLFAVATWTTTLLLLHKYFSASCGY